MWTSGEREGRGFGCEFPPMGQTYVFISWVLQLLSLQNFLIRGSFFSFSFLRLGLFSSSSSFFRPPLEEF